MTAALASRAKAKPELRAAPAPARTRRHAAEGFVPPIASLAAVPAGPAVQRRCGACESEAGERASFESRFRHDFSRIPVRGAMPRDEFAPDASANGPKGGMSPKPRILPRPDDGPKTKDRPPKCAVGEQAGLKRSVDLQPIFFRDNDKDRSPTGKTLSTRLGVANEVWGKLGVTFNALGATMLDDAKHKRMGSSKDEIWEIGALVSSGFRVYFMDNAMADSRGGTTVSARAASFTVISDGGSSTLLAHELGHALGLGHPDDGGADAKTIMQYSGSRDEEHSRLNTLGNYNRITWPDGGAATCIKPDIIAAESPRPGIGGTGR